MANLYTNLKRNKEGLDASSLRIQGGLQGYGRAYEDFGSSLKPPSQRKNATSVAGNSTKYGKFKPVHNRPSSPEAKKSSATRPVNRNQLPSRSRSKSVSRRATSTNKRASSQPIELTDSDDEMDLLSQSDDPSSFQKPVSQTSECDTPKPKRGRSPSKASMKPKADPAKDKVYVDPSGTSHQYNPNFKPTNVLSRLKFKKTKQVSETDSLPLTSQLPTSLQPSKPPTTSVSKENLAGSSHLSEDDVVFVNHGSPLSKKSANSNRRPKSPPASMPSKERRSQDSSRIPVPSSYPTGRPKPKPRPIGKASTHADLSGSQSSTKAAGGSQIKASSSLAALDKLPGKTPGRMYLIRKSSRSRSKSRSLSPSQTRRAFPEIAPRRALLPTVQPTISPPLTHATWPKPKAAKFPMLEDPDLHANDDTSPKADLSSSSRQAQPFPMLEDSDLHQGNDEPSLEVASSSSSRQAQPFPMQEDSDLHAESDDPSPKAARMSSSRQAKPFPMLLSKETETTKETRGRTRIRKGKKTDADSVFTDAGPDSDVGGGSIVVRRNPKAKGKEKEVEKPVPRREKKRPKINAFPMSAQMLQSIESPPSVGASRSGKRLSQGGSDDERLTKKSRTSVNESILVSPTRPFEDEGDSLLMAPGVDPKTLCPYCDARLPSKPSQFLLDALAAIRKKSTRDPRPSNPLGLKAPLAIFITACQRHRFESQILPEAEKKGWPKKIEWKKVAGRIMKMEKALKALIEDPGLDLETGPDDNGSDEEDDWEIPFGAKKKGKGKKGAKASSIFWMEVMDEVKQKGTRAVTGVRGQFANFEKTQPGYYGEQGSVIIHQTLYNMFPPGSMDPVLISPLTANEFVQKILVPEVALRLIMEDRDLDGEDGKLEALVVLRESSAYGVAMFPEDGGEWGSSKKKLKDDQLGVGDMIVMERARKRRKELEEEEEMEEEERKLASEMEREGQRKKDVPVTVRTRAKSRAREERQSSVDVEAPRPPKPRPRPVAKASSSKSVIAPQMTLTAAPRPRGLTNRTRGQSPHIDTDPTSGFETNVEISESDSDPGYRATSEDRRRSPSASETKRQVSVKPYSSRSTSRGIAGLNLSSADSDSSSKAVVGAEKQRTRTRNRSRSVVAPKMPSSSEKMDVDGDSDSDDVEVVDLLLTKTPVQLRRAIERVDDEETPKAGQPSNKALPPLLRAKQRSTAQSWATKQNSRQGSSSRAPSAERYEWLLSSSSQ